LSWNSENKKIKFLPLFGKILLSFTIYGIHIDITLLPLLAQSLGVTTDELLTDIKAEKNDPKPKEVRIFGLAGTAIETPEEFEFIFEKTKKEIPYLHIHLGKQIQTLNAKARGFIAIGNNAKGFISTGLFSVRLVSLGLVSLGLLALYIFALGLVSISAFAFGGVVFGVISLGVISFDGISQ